MEKQKRYEELKWMEAPLCYNDNASSSSSLLESHDAEEIKTTRHRLPLHAESTALLCVDVQPEYWSHCPQVRRDFPDFPKYLQRTVDICRQRRAKIIWVRADYQRQHSPWLVQFERLRGKMPGFRVEVPCDPHDFSWEDFAMPVAGEVVIPKTSWSSTNDTALKEILRESGIDTVLVCGLITSVCVQHSAFGVFEAGYRTLLVTNACADRGRARHEAALALYGDYMYELVTSQDLQHPTTGLVPAEKPRWLTLESIACRRRSTAHDSDDVSPLSSFGDLQKALHLLPVKMSGGNPDGKNEESTLFSSSMTASSSDDCSSD